MTRKVLALAALHLVLAGAALVAAGDPGGRTTAQALLGFATAFAVVGLLPMHLEFRRGAFTVVLDEAVCVVALFVLDPAAVVVAAGAGELVNRLVTRQQPLKLVYNVAGTVGGVALAAAAFNLLGATSAGSPAAWLAALFGISCWSLSSSTSVAVVLAMAERRTVRDVWRASRLTSTVATVACATLGVTAVALHQAHPLAPALLVPLLAVVVLGTRQQAASAADHLRFQRLYEAAARTGGLAGFDEALATLASEARGLATGAVAACCARRSDGTWVAMVVDDSGSRAARPDAANALAALEPGGCAVLPGDALPPAVQALAPQAADVVWARTNAGRGAEVVLAVFREILPDEHGAGRADVLAAFAGHAALTVANARLYAEVEDALQRQVDLNSQKGEFVAAVSHELRTPLTSILAAVATVRRLSSRLEPAAREKLLTTALTQGDHLRRLIDELLLVAAAEHGGLLAAKMPVAVAPLVNSVVADLTPIAGSRLRADTSDDLGVVQTDEGKLRQIVRNLVENAAKYAPDGPIVVSAARTGGVVEISVVDAGPGIPEADRERAFERFVQLDQSSTRRRGGTGLGLYLCRQLADLLGATLTLQQAETGGCRFTLALPEGDAGVADGRRTQLEPIMVGGRA